MDSQVWTFLERSRWPSGPWDGEPDKAQWTDPATGLPCLAVRHPSGGHWCGYVGVTPGHRFHGRDAGACPEGCDANWCAHSPEGSLDVHGGISFTDRCAEDRAQGVCHVPAPGEPSDVWWLGFDCAHSGDYGPRQAAYAYGRACSYWTLLEVRQECAALARQLAAGC